MAFIPQRIAHTLAALVLAAPMSALADATVAVELRGESGASVDGQVSLERGEARHTCQTQAGKCRIEGVAGGTYTVQVSQPGKKPPGPRQVMIPPSGEVTLIVRGAD